MLRNLHILCDAEKKMRHRVTNIVGIVNFCIYILRIDIYIVTGILQIQQIFKKIVMQAQIWPLFYVCTDINIYRGLYMKKNIYIGKNM